MERTKAPGKKISRVQEAVATIRPRQRQKENSDANKKLFPSGSTLLNCALADRYDVGIGQGKIINIVGDSSAGKTMLAETMLAEMANDPAYDEYKLYLDDSEHALEMDMGYLFGKKAARRIRAPRYSSDGTPLYSDTVEQWYAIMLDLIAADEPFIYALDSLDTLTDVAEYEQAEKLQKQAEKMGDIRDELAMPGSYGMAKARLLSQILRTIKAGLAKTGSTLLIISQTRDNINARPGQSTKKRAGGRALDFYCTHIVWLSPIQTYKAGKNENKKEVIGREVEAKVTKNKLTGKLRAVTFPIYYDYGVDDLGSCIEFLADYNVLKKKGGRLDCSILDLTEKALLKSELIALAENDAELWGRIRELVGATWSDKEEALRLGRKPRFR